MKLIRAIVRTERETEVLESLEAAGLYGVTKVPVVGRGRQQGIQVGDVNYDMLSKLMLLLAVSDRELPVAIQCIERSAYTGHPGDGKIFVQDLLESHTIRTGEAIHEDR